MERKPNYPGKPEGSSAEANDSSLERVVRTITESCRQCGAQCHQIDHNGGNIPGVGYYEEFLHECKTCGVRWWS